MCELGRSQGPRFLFCGPSPAFPAAPRSFRVVVLEHLSWQMPLHVSYLTCATASEMGVLFIKQKTEAQSSLLQMQNLGWNLGRLSSHCAFRWSDDPLISICSTWELLGNAHTWIYSGPAGLETEGLGDNLWLTSTVWFWGTQKRLSLSLFKGRERADVFLSPNSMPGTRIKAFSWICDVILTMPFYRWGNCSSNFPLSVMCKMTRGYTC